MKNTLPNHTRGDCKEGRKQPQRGGEGRRGSGKVNRVPSTTTTTTTHTHTHTHTEAPRPRNGECPTSPQHFHSHSTPEGRHTSPRATIRIVTTTPSERRGMEEAKGGARWVGTVWQRRWKGNRERASKGGRRGGVVGQRVRQTNSLVGRGGVLQPHEEATQDTRDQHNSGNN